ncbi:hypothetical protein B0T24DRAFT_3616 [Lasiosphaeria ovina]|uniref:Uncharacterized protein n=1 Tax=Lasiosphaeria ovina TaxID=92902 RepID=A0AAE0NIN9_9PEZI|nr:hypothetical protein B0T24DRAFT_3616 [Lasiosphaeria ovina]
MAAWTRRTGNEPQGRAGGPRCCCRKGGSCTCWMQRQATGEFAPHQSGTRCWRRRGLVAPSFIVPTPTKSLLLQVPTAQRTSMEFRPTHFRQASPEEHNTAKRAPFLDPLRCKLLSVARAAVLRKAHLFAASLGLSSRLELFSRRQLSPNFPRQLKIELPQLARIGISSLVFQEKQSHSQTSTVARQTRASAHLQGKMATHEM